MPYIQLVDDQHWEPIREFHVQIDSACPGFRAIIGRVKVTTIYVMCLPSLNPKP